MHFIQVLLVLRAANLEQVSQNILTIFQHITGDHMELYYPFIHEKLKKQDDLIPLYQELDLPREPLKKREEKEATETEIIIIQL